MIRSLLAAVLVAGSIGLPVANAVPTASGWIVTRTGSAPAVFSAWLDAEAGGSGATVGAFAVVGRGAARVHDSAFTTTRIDWGTDAWVDVYGSPVAMPSCQAAACDDPTRTPARIGIHTNGHRVASTIYVAAWEATSSLEITSPGWRARPWRPAMRVVRAAEGGGRGVRVTHTTYGTFGEAVAGGGRYGSFAFASLPCGTWGTGDGTFEGGERRFTLRCDGGKGWHSSARRTTRWRLTGDVDAVGPVVNVLVVVDYPR